MVSPVWKYDLSNNGGQLRELINNDDESAENSAAVLEQLAYSLKILKMKLDKADKEDFEDRINDLLEFMDGEPEILRVQAQDEREDKLSDIGYDGDTPHVNLVNDRLAEFYDLCDDCRCWVGFKYGEC